MADTADVIVVGAGLAGLVAATELADAGKRVIVVDQEGPQNLGGQAFWSLGGLFLVDTPEQRRLKIRDSYELAWQDWQGTAGFDRDEDDWPRRWAQAYVQFAATEKRDWLRAMGHRIFPVVGWAERGGYDAMGHGNSVPRFHISWGTGPGVVEPFERRAREAERAGRITFRFRHRVDALTMTNGAATGVSGAVLEPTKVKRGESSSRTVVGEFALTAQAVIVASGGIGGNHDLVRQNWPSRLGAPPQRMVAGVPAHVDGRMIGITEAAGGRLINRDRMWHYVEGLHNWDPIWPNHGIRILPGPSSMWFDARGQRLPSPLYPGYDTLGQLAYIMASGYDYSWFILTQSIIKKEFALSGSEQNPDLTSKSWRMTLKRATNKGAPGPVEAFKARGADFIVRNSLEDLVAGMNTLAGNDLLSAADIRNQIEARDRELDNPYVKDTQVMGIHNARRYLGDKLIRTAKPHRILDPAHGPLIAVRLNILTRKTLGGFETDLDARVFGAGRQIIPGLYAVGEAAGFGGGGMHGYRALEGTFLGGCLFSGRAAGRAAAQAVA
ncbi:FAD-binding dehydrogenase [Bradyrhizobium sp. U87765 SZCCT0131]|uniref:FAD-binding dehydrogenase n=1 Tax=unclassified Bradyrhizobium TaxID=2631580 RepID=UPI001BABD9C8|nr:MULTISPECIES: FAD-binding dehydrogenase [unclassified Bradyrhizobium]MBR1221046.1 FAD-binding dehydrogenase [Bradyrhizobium sp. U87765 SZCCT0131]MBR1260134.1 FAD-binding dehydrogenase [Bradyrhizobium sp. U87765 SZCCT0134]MBR1307617.1 FAD-binding dehydrogenase [Bradyrhizobium sp. U87765 SZCCT0110]MBR1321571.1 FAD-binding dehydrogenase [Bradyrhizobium sp. U87765 SZCCT0109]MBR1349884.1 FAD-binding dehydrogenase [Bradyrhizobium sp. U87765 SZCCT0048]